MSVPHPTPISGRTRFCAVYGHPVEHSASPAMQNAGLAALGLDWRYLAFAVRPDDLPAAIAGAQAMHFIGLNLTVPHKQLAVDLVDVLEPAARVYGAVNTIRFEGRDHEAADWRPLAEFPDTLPSKLRAHGFNTDAEALTESLREDLELEFAGATALVLGAGGAGRTAALRLAEAGVAQIFLVNRTADKAAGVAAQIRQRFPATGLELGYPRQPVDLLLNATSLGLNAGDPLPLDQTAFALSQARAVYDMIYQPTETPLLKRARASGCRTANGLGMLLRQGARALELWTGRPAPIPVLRQALHDHF